MIFSFPKNNPCKYICVYLCKKDDRDKITNVFQPSFRSFRLHFSNLPRFVRDIDFWSCRRIVDWDPLSKIREQVGNHHFDKWCSTRLAARWRREVRVSRWLYRSMDRISRDSKGSKAYLPGAEVTVIKKAVPPGRGFSIALRLG